MKRIAILLTMCLLAGAWASAQQPAPPPPPPPPTDMTPKTVTVTAEGIDRDDALRQALRKALEQGAGQQIASYSQVKDYMLMRDTIYSRAAGVVQEYDVISGPEEKGGGIWEITIRATVRPDAVAQTWGEVQNVLDQIGRPRIMVLFEERIDGELQRDSIVAARLEQMLSQAGFDLVAGEMFDKARAESTEKDGAEIAKLAQKAGAQLLIRGQANANRAGIESVYGVPVAFYQCDVQARVYYADSGRIVATASLPATRRGVRSRREYSPQAARAALVDATFPDQPNGRRTPLAERLYTAVMENWATAITAGGEVIFEVESIDFRNYSKLKKALAEIKGVSSVDGDFTDNHAAFRLHTRVNASSLAELMLEPPFDGWLEVSDLKSNRIRAKLVTPIGD